MSLPLRVPSSCLLNPLEYSVHRLDADDIPLSELITDALFSNGAWPSFVHILAL